MMPPGFPRPSAPVRVMMPAPDPEWVASLRRRQEVIIQLSRGLRSWLSAVAENGVEEICSAIQELLGKEIAEQLRRLDEPQQPFQPAPISPEMLIRASEDRDAIQKQIDALDAFLDEVPKAQADFIESQIRPGLTARLAEAETWISALQKGLEEQPPVPFPGPISTFCAKCGERFSLSSSSSAGAVEQIAKLKQALSIAGWGRDPEGDHICPVCLAASTEPKP
jgi:hypothetical protein